MRTLIQNGTVIDGTGSAGRRADVLVENDVIAEMAPGIRADADVVLDAQGKTVTPGFVDVHRHCDVAPMLDPEFGKIELAQGITTVVGGNCGLAPVPCSPECRDEMYDFIAPIVGNIPKDMMFGSYRDYAGALAAAPLRLNMGFLAGSGAVKTAVKGFSSKPYTPAETAAAQQHIREAMEVGALGVSLGIMYQPEAYSTEREIADVVRPAAAYDAVLTAHIRGEGDSLVESVREVIRIARDAEMRLNISHFKATGIRNWNRKIFEAIEEIEKARAAGQEVTADFYPYDGGSSLLQSLIPPTLLGESNQELYRRLGTREGRELLRREIYKEHEGWDNMAASIGWDRILISSVTRPEHTAFSGKSIASLAEELGCTDPADLVADLMASEEGKVGIIVCSMAQEDVDAIAKLPWTALISDALYGGGDCPHPRLYGAFPKFIREYVMQRGVLDLPTAIRKMTSVPAGRMGIAGRGLLQPGYKADILVFDPARLCDFATYTNPRQLCTGIDYALVNGTVAWENEQLTQQHSGAVQRRGLLG